MCRTILLLFPGLFACQPGMVPEDIPTTDAGYPSLPTLDAAITEAMSDGNVPGVAACIIKDGETAWCGGYGYADLKAKRTVTPTTPFMLASTSKAVTGVALVQVIESGAIGLDDPINDHLDFDVRHPDDGTPITARMLMSHTAGIADNWDVTVSYTHLTLPTTYTV